LSNAKRCFVITPIGDENTLTRRRADQILKYVIEPAVAKFGYDTTRADQIARPGLITSQIIEHLIEDELVIADISERNPNVFYELAIRHTIKKPFIQIKEAADTIPFDVTGMRTIDVDFRFIDSMQRCRDDIIKQIETIEKDPSKIESPITFTMNLMSLTKNSDAQSKVISDLVSQVQSLRSEIEKMQNSNRPRLIKLDPSETKFELNEGFLSALAAIPPIEAFQALQTSTYKLGKKQNNQKDEQKFT
jgi:hypothetical protein